MSVANNAEAVGRLLATSTLMKGERELLRKQAEPASEPAPTSTTSTSAPPPLVHDSKALDAVLLQLLNERLEASDAEVMKQKQTSSDGRRLATEDAADSSKRVAARYADDGLPTVSDPLRAEAVVVAAQPGRLPEATGGVAGDLQTFMQRVASFAAGRADARLDGYSRDGPERNATGVTDGTAVAGILVVALLVVWLAALLTGWIPG